MFNSNKTNLIGLGVLILGVLVQSCTSTPEREHSNPEGLLIPVDIRAFEEKSDIEIYEPDIQYIIPDTIGVFGNIKKVMVFEDMLFIKTGFEQYTWDNSKTSIVIMDMNGKFFREIKAIGKGPGEYVGLFDFVLDTERKEIAIYDRAQKKLIRYSFNGEFVDEFTVGPEYYSGLSIFNGHYVLFNNYPDFEAKHYLTLYNVEGEVVKKAFEIPYGLQEKLPAGLQKYFSHDPKNFSFITLGSQSVFTLDNELNAKTKYQLDLGPYALPPGTTIYTFTDLNKGDIRHYYPLFNKYFETDKYMVMTFSQNENIMKMLVYNKKSSLTNILVSDRSFALDGLIRIPVAMFDNKMLFMHTSFWVDKYNSEGKSTAKLSADQLSDIKANDKTFFSVATLKSLEE